ncbi:MAG TPA: HD domain-containing protein [Actinophytocola sp.]|uniref:HD domain-containing protein n=1 Tax=Actinophytocola sp. TaxID=1872138 RepID=UPI002DDCD593|nr:HD domain-containing protein [Actinophytocola sp.]HEV2783793.1 HD domain-containing protein [Actinophytocola sp.]
MTLREILDSANPRDAANIAWLVDHAAAKLILVRDTFPDYTLHDRQHSENVVTLMERLLGPDIEKVTPLEAAMLILAAYFHDIGMVYHPDELTELIKEQDFQDFLNDNPTAYLRARQADEPPNDVILQYCRTRHAARAREHLHRIGSGKLSWEGVAITEAMATLCQSHGRPLADLRSEKFPTAFLASCDLRMCAILLRLADILDFDDTRSPAAIYEHLRLAGSEGARALSDVEWSKHLASSGFRFPPTRTPNYALTVLASPRLPAVENAIRRFLDLVDEELRGCRILLDFCDERWRSMALPGSVDRTGIQSDGYLYGDYKFTLDRHAVLNLFMGDRLYADPYVFIRELLQNAIDACRLNVYLHDADPDSMEVRVSAWEDDAGNYWLRVDDTGVGMDREIVEKYFLGVGRSYYNSDELQADVLRKNKPQQKFVAISRFGIGVLSSFIVGDRIEVSTRRRRPDGRLADPLRLSLDSVDDFFVIREKPMAVCERFPSRSGGEPGYRGVAGTSVAIRINPTRSDVALEKLLERARNYFFFPPVRVYLDDVEQPGRGIAELDTPIVDGATRHPVTGRHRDEQHANLLATTELSVVVLPMNLTAGSPTPAVRGQLVGITTEATGSASLLPAIPAELRERLSDSLARSLDRCIIDRRTSVLLRGDGSVLVELRVGCRRSVLDELRNRLGGWEFQRQFGYLDTRWEVVDLTGYYRFTLPELVGEAAESLRRRIWLGHNGIGVPPHAGSRESVWGPANPGLLSEGRPIVLGRVGLFDELRPDVPVSRDTLRGLSFEVQSALHLAVRRAANAYLGTREHDLAMKIANADLLIARPPAGVTAAQIDGDPLAGQWRTEKLIPLGDDLLGVEEVRGLARDGSVTLTLPAWSGFYDTMCRSLVESELDIEILPKSKVDTREPRAYQVIVRSADRPTRPRGLSALAPFAAVPYPSSEVLIQSGFPANLRHPVVAWFAERATMLAAEYPAIFAQLGRAIAFAADGLGAKSQLNSIAHQLNATLDRIRRSVPDAPAALHTEIYVDQDKALRSRP